MHLTGGQFKGRKIKTPSCARPTLSLVRESVFNILYSHFGDFSQKKFFDMFLGSSVMTFEALSRGFDVISCDTDSNAVKMAKANALEFKLSPLIIKSDAIRYLKNTNETFDVIYIDPPWDSSYLEIIATLKDKLNKDAIAIFECDKKKKPEITLQINSQDSFELFKEKNYGRCCLLFVKLR